MKELFFEIPTYVNKMTGPPRQARQARFGPCLDFGFLYAHKKQPVKIFFGTIIGPRLA